jgi:hypothetical protein
LFLLAGWLHLLLLLLLSSLLPLLLRSWALFWPVPPLWVLLQVLLLRAARLQAWRAFQV